VADQLVAVDKGGVPAATMPQAATVAAHTANQELPDMGVMVAATMRRLAATAIPRQQLAATAMVVVAMAGTTWSLWVVRCGLFS